MGQYFYLDGQTPVGPFSLRDVYTLLDREVVHPATIFCREGGADWQALGTFHELSGKTRVRDAGGDGSASSDSLSPDGTTRRRRRSSVSGASSEPPPNRLINLNAIIIAVLFSVVAIYVTYTIGHANQEVSIDEAAVAAPSK